MSAEKTKITVENLVATLDRIDQWLQVVRKGLESLPQDQVVEIDETVLPEVRQPEIFEC